jgi:transaldolase
MKEAQPFYNLGQGLRIDNATRNLLDDGTLRGHIEAPSVGGLASSSTVPTTP